MKSSSQIPAISNITDQLVQNPKGINSNNIIFKLDQQFMKHLSIAYQERKFFLQIYLDYMKLMKNVLNVCLCIAMIYELLNEELTEACKIQN